MIQSKMDDMGIYQKQKIPRIEGVQLHSLILDEPPTIDISNSGMGVNAIRSMFVRSSQHGSVVGWILSLATSQGVYFQSLWGF